MTVTWELIICIFYISHLLSNCLRLRQKASLCTNVDFLKQKHWLVLLSRRTRPVELQRYMGLNPRRSATLLTSCSAICFGGGYCFSVTFQEWLIVFTGHCIKKQTTCPLAVRPLKKNIFTLNRHIVMRSRIGGDINLRDISPELDLNLLPMRLKYQWGTYMAS